MAMAETELEDERIYVDLESDLTREAKAIEEINAERNGSKQTEENLNNKPQTMIKPSSRAAQFDGYLLDAIDKTLSSLGEPVKNTLYQHLEVDFGISKSRIPEKICTFSDIIHKLFGLGAARLELKFLQNLSESIQTEIECPECEGTFIEYVYDIRKKYELKTKNCQVINLEMR